MEIYKNESIEINLKNNEYIMSIKNINEYKNYYKALGNILNIKSIKNKMILNQSNMVSLSKYMKDVVIEDVNLLFKNMKLILEGLEKDGKCIYLLDMNDFMVIKKDNMNIILWLNVDKSVELKGDNMIIDFPFSKGNKYLSPELKKIEKIPNTISKKSIYYSLGLLMLNMINKFDRVENINVNNHIEMINNSKLYFSLLRCLEIDEEDRYYLWI